MEEKDREIKQLTEYVKKQKARIKQLEKEKDKEKDAAPATTAAVTAVTEASATTAATPATTTTAIFAPSLIATNSVAKSGDHLFWEMVKSESLFKQKLARSALNTFVCLLERIFTPSHLNIWTVDHKSFRAVSIKSHILCIDAVVSSSEQSTHTSATTATTTTAAGATTNATTSTNTYHRAFLRWKFVCQEIKKVESNNKIDELTKNAAILEQKNVKLKALLSRTHQANQRNMEDTNTFRKAQQDTLRELELVKQRDDQEKLALLEEVRLKSIEAEFSYDNELALQRAMNSDRFQSMPPPIATYQNMNNDITGINSYSSSTSNLPSPSQHRATSTDNSNKFINNNNSNRSSSISNNDNADVSSVTKRIEDQDRLLSEAYLKVDRLEKEMSTLSAALQHANELQLAKVSEINRLSRIITASERELSLLRSSLSDEIANKREVELEVSLLLKSKSETIQGLTNSFDIKLEQQLEEQFAQIQALKATISNLYGQVVSLSEDNESLRSLASMYGDSKTLLLQVREENTQLRSTIRDLKSIIHKTHSAVSSSASSIGSSSSSNNSSGFDSNTTAAAVTLTAKNKADLVKFIRDTMTSIADLRKFEKLNLLKFQNSMTEIDHKLTKSLHHFMTTTFSEVFNRSTDNYVEDGVDLACISKRSLLSSSGSEVSSSQIIDGINNSSNMNNSLIGSNSSSRSGDGGGSSLTNSINNHNDDLFHLRQTLTAKMEVLRLELNELESSAIPDSYFEGASVLILPGKHVNVVLNNPHQARRSMQPPSSDEKGDIKLFGRIELVVVGDNAGSVKVVLSDLSASGPGVECQLRKGGVGGGVSEVAKHKDTHGSKLALPTGSRSIGNKFYGEEDDLSTVIPLTFSMGDGTKLLKLTNGSWTNSTVSYAVRASFRTDESIEQRRLRLQTQLDIYNSFIQKSDMFIAEAKRLHRRLNLCIFKPSSSSPSPLPSPRLSSSQDTNNSSNSRSVFPSSSPYRFLDVSVLIPDDFSNQSRLMLNDKLSEMYTYSTKLLNMLNESPNRIEMSPVLGSMSNSNSNSLGNISNSLINSTPAKKKENQPNNNASAVSKITSFDSNSDLIASFDINNNNSNNNTSDKDIDSTDNNNNSNDNDDSDPPALVYFCERLHIKANQDIRVVFPHGLLMENANIFKLEWEFHSESDKYDVGFSVVYRTPDGVLPQLVEYRRTSKGKGHIFLYHEVNEKTKRILRNKDSGSGSSSSNIDGSVDSLTSSSSSSNRELSSVEDGSFRVNGDVIIVFDNSFSWYTGKNIKYRLSLNIAKGSEGESQNHNNNNNMNSNNYDNNDNNNNKEVTYSAAKCSSNSNGNDSNDNINMMVLSPSGRSFPPRTVSSSTLESGGSGGINIGNNGDDIDDGDDNNDDDGVSSSRNSSSSSSRSKCRGLEGVLSLIELAMGLQGRISAFKSACSEVMGEFDTD